MAWHDVTRRRLAVADQDDPARLASHDPAMLVRSAESVLRGHLSARARQAAEFLSRPSWQDRTMPRTAVEQGGAIPGWVVAG